MADSDYVRCRFSITCHTDDLAVVHCLRALCQYAEHKCPPQIAWGGTKEKDWAAAGDRITLRFTCPSYREEFVRQAERLLPQGSWRKVTCLPAQDGP